ncbi:GNAT family N-acetyltransferase [Mesorhizobium sp. NBSH29]|uniref:GNAT family N-acetyltransferase n=1 Tax=Mesorhizobium sp. NBSH29 TaxID=2654249 RepID=UPI0018966262|nr:GNAT family N-acetyltransferase [Mesorhizobium sp. NBSH29]QPC87865.1 GNAT family N-acetyltransferase [Mesorhizobium sp. NBSH29]
MFVRTTSERDLSAISALLAETWHATYDEIYGSAKVAEITGAWHSVAALEARLALPRSEFLVADDGKTLGGVAFAQADGDGATVMLKQLYIRPAFQGRGIGSMLLDEIIESFFEAKRIRLEVEEKNEKAVAFYLSQGFVAMGRTPHCGADQSGIPALIYERTLT